MECVAVLASILGVLLTIFSIVRGIICYVESKPFFFLTGHVIVGRKIQGGALQYAIREKRAFVFKSRYLDINYGGTTRDHRRAFIDSLDKCREVMSLLNYKKPKEFVISDKGAMKLL